MDRGQPFLTQKVCQLVLDWSQPILEQEMKWVSHIVQTQVIQNWEGQDEPEHLRTIRDRLFRSQQNPSRLLGLYQQILQQSTISADDSPEQAELRLSGLVVKQGGLLKVYNPIYAAVFNQQWVQESLAKLRPYEESLKSWLASGRTDDSRLLRGKALLDALDWAAGKQLRQEDQEFLSSSQIMADRNAREISELISQSARVETAAILRQLMPELEQITNHLQVVIPLMQEWTGSQPFLTEQLGQLLIAAGTIPDQQEAHWIEQIVQTQLVQNWENQTAAEHLKTIQDALVEDEKSVDLLQRYQQILQQQATIAEDSSELRTLLKLGLVENQDGHLRVANRIYTKVFNSKWVEQELARARTRRIIRRRFEVLRELGEGKAIRTYLVKDRDVPNQDQCLVKELTPASTDVDSLGRIQSLFNERFKALEKLNGHDQIPRLSASFEENQKFYSVQEFIEGHNLDIEIMSNQLWNESEVINLLVEVLEVLKFVHDQDMYHLNLKPSNLRRRQNGRIVLIDFGTLKEIHVLAIPEAAANQSLGETGYIPPDADSRSRASQDIYALGMIGIEALTGNSPQNLSMDRSSGELIWRYAVADKPMVKISGRLEAILNKMVRHRNEDCYHDVAEVLIDLRTLRDTLYPTSRYAWLTRKRKIIGIAGLLLIGIASFGYWAAHRSREEPCSITMVKQSNKEELLDIRAKCTPIINKQNNDSHVYLNALKTRGLVNLLLWKMMSAQDFLNDALQDFKQASEQPNDDPQIFFYRGLVEFLQNNSAYKEHCYKAIELYRQKRPEAIKDDFPILVKLGFFLIQDNQYRQRDFTAANLIFQQARDLNPDSLNLIYSQASLNARAGNYRGAVQIFDDLMAAQHHQNSSSNYRAQLSQGFAFLLSGRNGFQEARDALKAVPSDSEPRVRQLASNYGSKLESCLSSTRTCSLDDPPLTELKPKLDFIFPYLPVYDCKNYPVLRIADQHSHLKLCTNSQSLEALLR
jgi:serine/threonine protein kinase